LDELPAEVEKHSLLEEKLVCPECGNPMTEIGKNARQRLKLESAKIFVVDDGTTPIPTGSARRKVLRRL